MHSPYLCISARAKTRLGSLKSGVETYASFIKKNRCINMGSQETQGPKPLCVKGGGTTLLIRGKFKTHMKCSEQSLTCVSPVSVEYFFKERIPQFYLTLIISILQFYLTIQKINKNFLQERDRNKI